MEVDAIRSHFIEKNVIRIKNENETSEGRAKHINSRFERTKFSQFEVTVAQGTQSSLFFSAEHLSMQDLLSVVPFMNG